jgi:CBS domain-containing protein
MMRRVVASGADATKTPVEQIMSAPILTIEENKTLLDANDLMAQAHVRHLGVTRDGKLVGIISVRDLVVFLTNLPRK